MCPTSWCLFAVTPPPAVGVMHEIHVSVLEIYTCFKLPHPPKLHICAKRHYVGLRIWTGLSGCDRFWPVLPLVEALGLRYCLLVFWQRIPFFAVLTKNEPVWNRLAGVQHPDWGSQKLVISVKNGSVWNRLAGVQLRIGVPKLLIFAPKLTSLKLISRGSAPDWGSRIVHLSTSPPSQAIRAPALQSVIYFITYDSTHRVTVDERSEMNP